MIEVLPYQDAQKRLLSNSVRRAKALTPEPRSEIAKKAAAKRWDAAK
jgi:hypothetical protein